ncbi:TonB-dependent receptor [Oceanospirillum linum]|uniref:TonB-dependent receptor n=1 Tax=Oceanospirillum linum TaxID=966 RepID=A0A1T1H829_OCELI|nr:TonB-dependent receptor [Oceanospirillum linum]OOV86003.1 TonB-dependent receptor [Oceanospirillum linum]SEG44108.1 iron complex outermembrane recepter protein [Oleiphilus messinensis]SMP34268.1 iron complex outermembrane recepter protein [Oceanospirillum linum]
MIRPLFSHATLLAGALALTVTSAFAEEKTEKSAADDGVLLPELTITANKQEQTLSTAPVHASVYGGEQLQDEGIYGLSQLEGKFAGLSFQPFGQSGINSPVLRGLTANFNALSSSTLLMVDGVPTLTAQGYESTLVDVDRIEILRGPQSTVYGRNAEVGVISVFSKDLDGEDKTRLGLGIGSRNKKVVQASTSQTLIEDTLYASLAGEFVEQDGFIDNRTTGKKADDKEHQNLSAGVRWLMSEDTDIVVRYRRQSYDDGAMLWNSASATERTTVASGTDSYNTSVGQTFSINATHNTSSGLQFNSVTAYNDFQDEVQQDTDFSAAEILYIGRDNHLRTLSQEFRLEGNLGDSQWLVGAYLEKQDHDLSTTSKNYFGLTTLDAGQAGNSYALFTNWTVPLRSDVRLIAGLRGSRDEVTITPTSSDEKSETWTELTPQLTLQYLINPDHMAYATYAEGMRAGGFNMVTASADYSSYDPEKNQSFELGLKGKLLSQQLNYSLSAYHMNIDNMQVMQMPTAGVIYLTNAAEATSEGVEASLAYNFNDSWSMETGLAWNKTRFDKFVDGSSNYTGNTNLFAPEINGHATFRYDGSNSLSAAASLVATGSVYLNAANTYEQEGYKIINLSSSYAMTDNIRTSAYVNNIEDREYDAVGYQNGYVTVYSPPREFGFKFTMDL